jgi:hypothetical protein
MSDGIDYNRQLLKACFDGSVAADEEFRARFFGLIFSTIRETVKGPRLDVQAFHNLTEDCIGKIYEDWYPISGRRRDLYESVAEAALAYARDVDRRLKPKR